MRRLPPIPVSPALAEALAADGVLDDLISGRGLRFDNPPAPKAKPPAPFIIEPADWDQEERERRQAHDPERGLDPEQLEEQPAEHPPPRRRPWHRITA